MSRRKGLVCGGRDHNQTVKPTKLKFELKLVKESCVPILWILGHLIVNRDTKEHNKTAIFDLKIKLLIRLYFKNRITCKAEIWTQCGCL